MKTLFDAADRKSIEERLAGLQPDAARLWGKMDAAQMLAHCGNALEVAVGDKVRKQALIGKLLGRFVKDSLLGQKPFGRNSPTDPTFVITDERDFAAERKRLGSLIDRFSSEGVKACDARMHSFFGRLEGDEWGVLMYKHLDHHLQQFGA